jgi:hypothetical protein
MIGQMGIGMRLWRSPPAEEALFPCGRGKMGYGDELPVCCADDLATAQAWLPY